MTPQFQWLVAALILAFVHIFITAGAKRRQDGMEWAAGSRDDQPIYTGIAARLIRAEKNLNETLWIVVAALIVAHLCACDGALNLWGARLYVLARFAYVPLYASGVRLWRSAVFCISVLGVVLTLIALL
jgi:uncharacterized MAPEG superfamily protein